LSIENWLHILITHTSNHDPRYAADALLYERVVSWLGATE